MMPYSHSPTVPGTARQQARHPRLIRGSARPYSRFVNITKLIAAAAPTVHGTLRLLDEAGIRGELVLRDLRSGRVETVQMWGRPESVRQEFRRIRSQ